MSYLSVAQLSQSSTLDFTYNVYLVSLSGDITLTLPDIEGYDGQYFIIARKDNNSNFTLTVQGSFGQTIDGNSTTTIPPNSSQGFISSFSNWFRYL